MTEPTKTLCPYCGVGCGLEVFQTAKKKDFWQVKGDRDHPSSRGQICIKGATIAESLDKNRLEYPMMRDSLDEPFQRVSWDEVLTKICDRIANILQTRGPEAICMYGSGQLQTEDYYIAQKLLKGCLGTNNFDANSRLCMSSAVAGYIQSLGSDGPPCCYEDLDLTDCAFLIGTNTAECHPIIFNRLAKHRKNNPDLKIIVVDPRRTATAKIADLYLAIQPGTDIDLLNGIAHLLLSWGATDSLFIEKHTDGFADFAAIVQKYAPELVARRCQITIEELETAARYWQKSQKVLSLWSMGVNQSAEGTAKVRSIINLHLMTGNIGKPGAGPFSLTGQPNAMGGREAGGLSHLLPGYRLVKNPQHRQEVERVWGLRSGQISSIPGLSAWEMITGLELGEVGLFWVVATNPAVSMPDLDRTKKALKQSPLTICQDAYYPTETANYAHILLPAAQWGEKTGTMTNSERVVTFCPSFRKFPGEAKADWEIFAEVGRRLGFKEQFDFESSAEVYAEFVSLTKDRLCDLSGLSHSLLAKQKTIQWPFASGETQKTGKRLYTDFNFATANKKAKFAAVHSKGLAEPLDRNYPFILTTGRLYGHWHTQTRTGKIAKITKMHPQPFLEIHPRDAEKLGIAEGNTVEVRSPRGLVKLPAKITKAISPGTLFVPMHWGELWADLAEANALTHPIACPDSLQPELKACAVKVIPGGSKD
ncbi:MAG: nitrate reductase [Prochloraceae cyanobacterium]|nr:nitrate reductase [Prochloraceae cyanobacterium]